MKKIIKRILVLAFISITLSTAMPMTYAVTPAANQFKPSYIPRPSNLPGPESSEGARTKLVDSILPRFAVGMIGITGGFALLMIVIGGVRYLTAYGNEEAAGKGKNQIMYGVIGMIVALLAYTIVTAITNLNIENQTPAPATPTAQTPTTPIKS